MLNKAGDRVYSEVETTECRVQRCRGRRRRVVGEYILLLRKR